MLKNNKLSLLKIISLIIILGFILVVPLVSKEYSNLKETGFKNDTLKVLNLTNSIVTISIDDKTYTTFKEELDYVYIDRPREISIQTSDEIIIKYYVSKEVLTIEELDLLDEEEWVPYVSEFLIDEIGTYIFYVKAINSEEEVSYYNTDYIVYDGYINQSLKIGRGSNYEGFLPYITGKSTVTLNFKYLSTNAEISGNHNLMSNILFPKGTKITLIDNVKQKVYTYEITTDEDVYNYHESCASSDLGCEKIATYSFSLFNEVGAIDKSFVESSYFENGEVYENFTIVLDFAKTNITSNFLDVKVFLELKDLSGNSVRPTLYETINKFQIYARVNDKDTGANLDLTTDYSGTPIKYNTDSTTEITLTSKINYKFLGEIPIIDTTYENKNIGFAIKLVDDSGKIVNRNNLKNISFLVDGKAYYPEEDHIVRINLEKGIADISKKLTIITHKTQSYLEPGTYYLKINAYVSKGKYFSSLSSSEISIPVNVVQDKTKIPYAFNIVINNEDYVIAKSEEEREIMFNILQTSSFENPNIRIALYERQEKEEGPSYEIVDLNNFITDELEEAEENVYYAVEKAVNYISPDYLYNEFKLNLIPANFNYTSYKYVFMLYDGEEKIATIEKYFLVK